MGLFSRSTPSENEQNETFDDLELPSSRDLAGDPFTPEAAKPASPAPRTSRGGYGIEQAIELMQSLPRDNNEVVVTVVKKTLESAKIRVEDIIEDANAREERIRSQHKNLEAEIKELEAQIAKRNKQINELMEDQKCTADVRQRLQLALQLEKPARQASPPKAEPAAAANPSSPARPTPEAAAGKPAEATSRPEPSSPDTPAGGAGARRRAAQRGVQ